MAESIPRGIFDRTEPQPIRRETVATTPDGNGYFATLANLRIYQGFQWKGASNVSYAWEPGFPEEAARERVWQRIVHFLNTLGMDGKKAIHAYAVPGNATIVDITNPDELAAYYDCGRITAEGNAFFTTEPGLPLYSTAADCTQTIFYCERQGQTPVVGLIHAGRAEADKKMPLAAIKHAIERYGLDPAKIKLGITPSLEPAHHEIQAKDFSACVTDPDGWKPYMVRPVADGPYYLDAASYVVHQFITAGVLPQNIEMYAVGTFESAGRGEGFSNRRSTQNGSPRALFGVAVQIA